MTGVQFEVTSTPNSRMSSARMSSVARQTVKKTPVKGWLAV